ncbi:Medium-chain-fatty-acid--CoA ligase (plasmid) [Cupriavidus necator H850]|jgi:fatty-acyl-CoA synthase|nr:Medium-chain-fatty-acid--CoA ligase [Cupriavidus necator H850]
MLSAYTRPAAPKCCATNTWKRASRARDRSVNVRLSAQRILYTLNDSGAEVVLLHPDFLPVMEEIRCQLTSVRSFVLLADGQHVPPTSLPFGGEYEALLSAASSDFDFPEFDENTRAVTFYTTGTTGDPKGVCYSHRDISLG